MGACSRCPSRFSRREVVAAFRHMAQAQHVGKIVVRAMPAARRTRVRADGTYLITGGLTGWGSSVARWLAERGARHLVLMGRRPPPTRRDEDPGMETGGARSWWRKATSRGKTTCGRVLEEIGVELPPLRGVVHAAGISTTACWSSRTGALRQGVRPEGGGIVEPAPS